MAGHNSMAATLDTLKTRKELDEIEKSIRFMVQHMPGHADYLAKYCPAPPA